MTLSLIHGIESARALEQLVLQIRELQAVPFFQVVVDAASDPKRTDGTTQSLLMVAELGLRRHAQIVKILRGSAVSEFLSL